MKEQSRPASIPVFRMEDAGLQMIVNNVPGGVINCLFDEKLTLLYASDGFLNMVGYTRQQLQIEKENSLKALIPEEEFSPLMEEVERQMAVSDTKEIQYNLRRRDGQLISILDKGQLVCSEDGAQSFCCVLVDITERVCMQRELELTLARDQLLIEQSNDIIFECSGEDHKLFFSPAWEKMFGPPPDIEALKAVGTNKEKERIHPEDITTLGGFIAGLEHNPEPVKVRIRTVGGDYRWCLIRVVGQRDAAGNVIKYIGMIRDVDRETRRTEALIMKAERDALTGLYNRETAKQLMEERLAIRDGQSHALLMLDLDDFKKLNDTKGHLYGDNFLINFSRYLKSLLPECNIIARYGGDEFFLLLENISGADETAENASRILQISQFMQAGSSSIDMPVSACSVGIALYPQDADTYDQLFRCADIALYQAKGAGKNHYTFYQSAKATLGASFTAQNIELFESQQQTQSEFDLLYDAEDPAQAIRQLLESVGLQYNVSRVYVFEVSRDQKYMSNSFEWCNDGITPEIDLLQHMPLENYDNYFSNFDRNGIFYCRDLQSLPLSQQEVFASQGILSVLQCTMTDHGRIWGFVGFDDCREHRSWEPVQVQTLNRCARMISVFLRKIRLEETIDAAGGE